MSHSPQDRRRHERISINVEALVTIYTKGTGGAVLSVRGLATDISASGMQVRSRHLSRAQCDRLMNEDFRAEISVELPYLSKPVDFSGEIMWADELTKPGDTGLTLAMGILFERLTPDTKAKLDFVIGRLRGDSYDAVPVKGIPLIRKPKA